MSHREGQRAKVGTGINGLRGQWRRVEVGANAKRSRVRIGRSGKLIFGPSRCGKSTSLRLLAGVEELTITADPCHNHVAHSATGTPIGDERVGLRQECSIKRTQSTMTIRDVAKIAILRLMGRGRACQVPGSRRFYTPPWSRRCNWAAMVVSPAPSETWRWCRVLLCADLVWSCGDRMIAR